MCIRDRTYGILTAVIVAWVSYPVLLLPNREQTRKYFVLGINPGKLIAYFFWLMWQLVLANVDVIKATVGPELVINPCVVKFRYTIDNPMGTMILANSITPVSYTHLRSLLHLVLPDYYTYVPGSA